MGRTVPSFRMALEEEIGTWKWYRKALRGRSRRMLERVFASARRNCSASSNAVRPARFEGLFMAAAFEHERRLEDIAGMVERTRLELDARG